MKNANPFRVSLPSLRALTSELKKLHGAVVKAERLVAAGFDLWIWLVPTFEGRWRVMAGAKGRGSELVPARGRFDAVASARRLLARARDSVAYRKGPRP